MSTFRDGSLQGEYRPHQAANVEEARTSHLYVASRELIPGPLQTTAYTSSVVNYRNEVGAVVYGKERLSAAQVAEEVESRTDHRRRLNERCENGECNLTAYVGDAALREGLEFVLPSRSDRIVQLQVLHGREGVHVFASNTGQYPPIFGYKFDDGNPPTYWTDSYVYGDSMFQDSSGEIAAIFSQLEAAASASNNPYVRNAQASQHFIGRALAYLQRS